MICERLVNGEQNSIACRIGLVRVRPQLVLGDLYLSTGEAVIIQVGARILAIVWMKRQSQQTLFGAVKVHFAVDVQKGSSRGARCWRRGG